MDDEELLQQCPRGTKKVWILVKFDFEATNMLAIHSILPCRVNHVRGRRGIKYPPYFFLGGISAAESSRSQYKWTTQYHLEVSKVGYRSLEGQLLPTVPSVHYILYIHYYIHSFDFSPPKCHRSSSHPI
jgi:hypothetical protein